MRFVMFFTTWWCTTFPLKRFCYFRMNLQKNPRKGGTGYLSREWWQWRCPNRLLRYKGWSSRHECDLPKGDLLLNQGDGLDLKTTRKETLLNTLAESDSRPSDLCSDGLRRRARVSEGVLSGPVPVTAVGDWSRPWKMPAALILFCE